MFQWDKLGRLIDPVMLARNNFWMQEFAQSPSALIGERTVRVYFCSRSAQTPDGQYTSYISYVDLDRNELTRIVGICSEPVLQLGACGTFDEFGTNPVSVIRHDDEIRAYYAGLTRCESVPFNAAIGMAVSRDGGNSFRRLGHGPILSYGPDEPFVLGSPRVRKFMDHWYLWYVSGKIWLPAEGKSRPEPVYKIRMATSVDGINWMKFGKDLIEDRLGEQECQACPDVIFHSGKYHMFFSYRRSRDYKGLEGGYRVGYATSEDLKQWRRDDARAGMSVSASGWDSEMACYPHVFELDNDVYMLYQGNGMGRDGVGLARLRNTSAWIEQ